MVWLRRRTITTWMSVVCVVLLGIASGIGNVYLNEPEAFAAAFQTMVVVNRQQQHHDTAAAAMNSHRSLLWSGSEEAYQESLLDSAALAAPTAIQSLARARNLTSAAASRPPPPHHSQEVDVDEDTNADNSRSGCTHSFQCFTKFVCRQHECTYCVTDAECEVTNTKNRCFLYAPGKGECRHKTLLAHFDGSDMSILIITFLTIMLSAPAGTGGGGVLVPMYILIGQFSPHGAIPLSKATIFGGAIANNFFNLQRRHPRADRPVIDFRAVVMLEPILLLGTVMGVFTNAISPGWLITVMLVVTLMFVTYRTTLKGIEAYRVESQAETGGHLVDVVPDGQHTQEERMGLIATEMANHSSEPSKQKQLSEMMAAEARPVWPHETLVLIVAWIIIAVTASLKGGDGAAGVAKCGSTLYWTLVLAPVPIIGFISYLVARHLVADNERKVVLGYRFVDGDLRWSAKNVVRYPAYCYFAGFAAGALGIAAGTVLGPVLLEMGMLPIVATASSGFMVLFTASSTTTQFLILGQLQLDYAVFFALIGVVGGGLGNTGVNYLVKKWRKTYFIIFILAGIIGVSVVLMGFTGAVREFRDMQHGKSAGFRPLCAH